MNKIDLLQLGDLEDFFSKKKDTEEENDMLDVLDAILEMQEGSAHADTLHEAVRSNEVLQREIYQRIAQIDQRIHSSTREMVDLKDLTLQEASLNKLKRVADYDHTVSYFDQSELLETTSFTKTSESTDAEKVKPKRKAWTEHERKRLYEGIHTEAKRMMTVSFLKRNEPWRVWEADKADAKTLEIYPVNKIDWVRVSRMHVKTRDTTECLIQWTTQEHPLINKTPWTKPESEKLKELVDRYGEVGQWEKIASELGTNRTISQCFSRHMASQHNEDTERLKWTTAEDRELIECVKVLGTCNWQSVAAAIGSRTGQQCLQRWTKCIDPLIKRSRWTLSEDIVLKKAVELYGVGNWRMIQRLVNQRTDMQCRERWVNMLDKTLNHAPVTKEEEEKIFELVQTFGTKWSLIAQHLPGRTDNSVMKIYKRLAKKKTLPSLEKKKSTVKKKMPPDSVDFPPQKSPSNDKNAERENRREQRAKRRAELIPSQSNSKKSKKQL
ncbi:hypothetical protein BY458DRAFT_494690 [Sporodiniella umbellata]|nr:hypothetical protein BY458DRAFT_494690 [Sporodiniella umbellata]